MMNTLQGLLFLQLFFSLSLFAGCACQRKDVEQNIQKQESKTPLESCICPKDYRPVCGMDKTTYSNACSADCAKVKILHHGACLKETQQ